ncbi:hypothetical protein Dimus_006489 [Dionaea muscipula]
MVGARRGRLPKHRASAAAVVKSGVKEGVKDTPGGLGHDKLREDFGDEVNGAQSSVRAGSVSTSKATGTAPSSIWFRSKWDCRMERYPTLGVLRATRRKVRDEKLRQVGGQEQVAVQGGRDALVNSGAVAPLKTSMKGLDKGKEMMEGRWAPVKRGGRPCQMQEDIGVAEVSISSCFEALQVCGESEMTHPSDDRAQIGYVDIRDCHEGVLGGYRSPEVNGDHDSWLLECTGPQ